MATTQEIKERIAAFARELAVDLGDVDDSESSLKNGLLAESA